MRTIKSVENSLDKLWAQAIKQRDGYKCQKCGGVGTDPHHIFSRINKATRWNPQNGITLCRECHTGSNGLQRSMTKPRRNIEVVLKHVGGEKELDELRLLAKGVYKSTLQELIDLESEYKKVVK
jgi:5-methylcytosine-specific restriction endonuclease McrA